VGGNNAQATRSDLSELCVDLVGEPLGEFVLVRIAAVVRERTDKRRVFIRHPAGQMGFIDQKEINAAGDAEQNQSSKKSLRRPNDLRRLTPLESSL